MLMMCEVLFLSFVSLDDDGRDQSVFIDWRACKCLIHVWCVLVCWWVVMQLSDIDAIQRFRETPECGALWYDPFHSILSIEAHVSLHIYIF
jgi:hypothetical protein